MVNGIINIYKEKGFTSFDVVAKCRGIFKQKKIGHTGTLDPDAEGVLPVCLGKATKVCDLLTEKEKEYEAVMLLGKITDTQDISGVVLKEQKVEVTKQEVTDAILSFIGNYMQIPPMYSALKVNGKKLCDMAREGKTIERIARPVIIYDIQILKIELPRVTMHVRCSKGTYIRTLCEDIGMKLGCGACMEKLVRTRVSEFKIENSLTLKEVEMLVAEEDFSFVQAVDSVFLNYPRATAEKKYEKFIINGNRLEAYMLIEESIGLRNQPVRIYDEEGCFIGIYGYDEKQNNYKPVKLFIGE